MDRTLRIHLQLFADDSSGEKTEDPTPRRRRKAREEGQIFQSKEVTQAVLLIGLSGILWFFGPSVGHYVKRLFVRSLTYQPESAWSVAEAHGMLIDALGGGLLALLPLMAGVMILGTVSSLAQTGFVMNKKALSPDLKRLDPVEGFKRIFSLRSVINLAKSLLKVVALVVVAYSIIVSNLDEFPGLLRLPLQQSLGWTADLLRTLVLQSAIVLVVVGVVDFWYERFEHERQLKMSKKEVKDEMKDTEGDPQLRGRIRNVQQQMARQRMMVDVAESDVVIVNPTQYAVALKYDFDAMEAPLVVGKGRGLVAQKIREVARERGVPIEERPPLARALYDVGEIGQYIPAELYRAVAEVLAYVWRRQGRAPRERGVG